VKIILREAALSDLPRLLELYMQLDFGPEKKLSLTKARSQFLRYGEYPNYRVYVAEAAGVIVGTFALIIIDSVAHGGKPFGIVEDVVVSADWQGKGIGKKMMQFAMARCKKMGCYKLALSSHLKREDAHKFYESLGFEKHGFSFQVALST
jgi:GNAT superfamily N-acetyltransferase